MSTTPSEHNRLGPIQALAFPGSEMPLAECGRAWHVSDVTAAICTNEAFR
jgi:hypothetical protein